MPGFATISASSENVMTPTRSVDGVLAMALFASCFARSNRPGADRLYDVSSATTVTPDAVAAPRAKKGRAKASARSTSAATRSARSSSSRSRCFSVFSTGACFRSLTAANLMRGSGSRLSRWRMTGTAAVSAPTRNRGERKEITARETS